METRVWHKVGEKQGAVLSMTGDTLYRVGFSGKDVKRDVAQAVTALQAGQDPAGIVGGEVKAVPLASIRRVEVSHGRDTVKFLTSEGGNNPVKVEFDGGSDSPEIARAVVDRAGITHPERTEDIGVVEALLAPVILGVIVGVLWLIVYGMATGMEGGEEVHNNRVGRRGRGLGVLFGFIAQILGTNGTIILGAVLLVAFIGWGVMRIVKRPQRMVWGPTDA